MFKNKYILAVLSGLILYISWPPMVFPFFVFIGLVPLFMIEQHFHEHQIRRGSWKLFGYLYLAFLIWNILTTWWVYNASPAAIIAISLNSLFMCIPFILYHHTRKKLNNFWSFVALVSYWLAFEHLHLRWDISWPWLTLGNVFAKWPSIVQWYEYTGFMGGTVWVWVVNILVFGLYMNFSKGLQENNLLKKSAIVDLVIIVPIVISLLIYKIYKPSEKSIKVMVVQPNLDPYTEKFNGLPADEQLMRMISLAESKLDSNVKLLILPETAITSIADEMDLNYNEEVRMI
ncbi:MAG: apolipoprotein N-acyltransferase, partial [Bacteroidetes bacterium]|nr:apolipoprotein N-acyltransferase [Bacteroidota bacterium]